MATYDTSRPDTQVFELTIEEKKDVTKQLRSRRFRCDSCGSADLSIGQALYLGFLFTNEEQDDYMVALTCRNPTCPSPRTGIKLHESTFLHQRGVHRDRKATGAAGGPRRQGA